MRWVGEEGAPEWGRDVGLTREERGISRDSRWVSALGRLEGAGSLDVDAERMGGPREGGTSRGGLVLREWAFWIFLTAPRWMVASAGRGSLNACCFSHSLFSSIVSVFPGDCGGLRNSRAWDGDDFGSEARGLGFSMIELWTWDDRFVLFCFGR